VFEIHVKGLTRSIKAYLLIIPYFLTVGNASAFTNEGLLKVCNSFAASNFSYESGSPISNTMCVSYITGHIDQQGYICRDMQATYQGILKEFGQDHPLLLSLHGMSLRAGTSADRTDRNAVIQSFINYAQENPETWKKTPSSTDWLVKKWPCDLQKTSD
jgi:hypothetical protein